MNVSQLTYNELNDYQRKIENERQRRLWAMSQQTNTKTCSRLNRDELIQRDFRQQVDNYNCGRWNNNTQGGSDYIDRNMVAGFNPDGSPFGTGSNNPVYQNPYEYGSRQISLEARNLPVYDGVWDADIDNILEMNLKPWQLTEKFPGESKNVNVESPLIQGQVTKLRGNRTLMELPMDRFEFPYFDPQDARHIVWSDNMPRGGYSTRLDDKHYRQY